MRIRGTALALTLTALLATLGAAPAAAVHGTTGTPVPLVQGATTTARISVPYPGHGTAFELTARPTVATPVELALLVDGGDSPLAAGPDALRLELADDAGHLLAAGSVAELGSSPIRLGTLRHGTMALHGTARLPVTAGDDLQGVGMTLRLTLVATAADDPSTPGRLAFTGSGVLPVALLGVALTCAGLLVLVARRRRHPEEEEA